MFDDVEVGDGTEGGAVITASMASDWLKTLATADLPADDAERIELIAALERLTNAARSAQARATVEFDASQRSEQAAASVPIERRGRSVAGQVALARQVSPFLGQRLHGLALVLDRELPCTAAAMRQGRLSEWRAQIIARQTATLSAEHRRVVDSEIAGDVDRLEQRGDRDLAGACARLAAELDPASVVARRRKAVRDRNVSLRPAPDTMSWFTGLLPVADGVAVITSLGLAADAARARGDERSRGQVMADTLIDRILGTDEVGTQQPGADQAGSDESRADESRADESRADESRADGARADGARTDGADTEPDRASQTRRDGRARTAPGVAGITWAECDMDRAPDTTETTTTTAAAATSVPARPGVMVNLTMSYDQLVHGADGAAWLDGYGPVDAELGREIVRQYDTWIRRLHTDPATGGLVGMDSKSRYFPEKLKELIRLRDQHCRTPWCDAPVRHIDHVRAHDMGGSTSYANGQGLCENCNYTKQAPGWQAASDRSGQGPPGTGDIITTTPTGHRYRSPAPAQPGDPPTVGPPAAGPSKVRIPRLPNARRGLPVIDLIFTPRYVA